MKEDIKYKLAKEYFDKRHTHLEVSVLLGVSETELYFILNNGSFNNMFSKHKKGTKIEEKRPSKPIFIHTNIHDIVSRNTKDTGI
jgi:hypothetical protein